MAGDTVADAAGTPVLLTQTGSYFKNIGCMTINPESAVGTITTTLISTYEGADPVVDAIA